MKSLKVVLVAFSAMLMCSCHHERRAEIEFETTMGTFRMQLFNETPLHRDAYLLLTKCGYFDSLLFHRVINNFVIQGGDPDSRHAKAGQLLGDGEPFRIPAEIVYPKFYHKRAMVLAAREGDDVNPERKSSGSQFAIVTAGPMSEERLQRAEKRIQMGMKDSTIVLSKKMREDYLKTGGTPHLDGQYTIFAEIVGGMNVVDSIQRVKTDSNDRPIDDVRIIKAKVVREF